MSRLRLLGTGLAAAAAVAAVMTTAGHRPSRGRPSGKVHVALHTTPPAASVAALSHSAASRSSSGLPMWPNFRLIPVWTTSGKPVYVNASVTPVLLFEAGDPGSAERVLAEALRVPGPHPVVLVAAGFPSESLARAEAQGRALSRAAFHGATVLLLQGPWTPYTKTLPALAYLAHTAVVPVVIPARHGVPGASLKRAFADTLAAVFARPGVRPKAHRRSKR